MKNVTLTEIRKRVQSNGGTYAKCGFYLNGKDCWEVNGTVMNKSDLVAAYRMGAL